MVISQSGKRTHCYIVSEDENEQILVSKELYFMLFEYAELEGKC